MVPRGEREGAGPQHLFPSTFPGPNAACCALNKREKTRGEFSTSELGREGGILLSHQAEAQHRAHEDSLVNELDCLFLALQIKEQSV